MFETYDYITEMKADILNYLESEKIELPNFKENPVLKNIWADKLYYLLEDDDDITGNGSGSYTFDRGEAEEYISGNMDLLVESIKFFGIDSLKVLEDGPEACDVLIRCYTLNAAIYAVLDEIEEKQ